MTREQRKLDHIKHALQLVDGPASTHLNDVRFLHNCLPELNPADVDLDCTLFGKRLKMPFLIDAITGSTPAVADINYRLAQVAARAGCAMAVGSQYGAVKSGDTEDRISYTIVREGNPEGVVIGNISALATPEEAQAAVDMLQAEALEVHLNAAQEVFMPEGDTDFAGLFDNLLAIKEKVNVPVIVKETGAGIAAEQYRLMTEAGLRYFDCAGSGGTNFAAIEASRAGETLSDDFAGWGLPTCWTLLDAAEVLGSVVQAEKPRYFNFSELFDELPSGILPYTPPFIIAGGGIRNAGDAARAFALGADAISITAPVLRYVMEEDVDAAVRYLHYIARELKRYMHLLGCAKVQDLRKVPLFITGETAQYIACRGYNLQNICKSRR